MLKKVHHTAFYEGFLGLSLASAALAIALLPLAACSSDEAGPRRRPASPDPAAPEGGAPTGRTERQARRPERPARLRFGRSDGGRATLVCADDDDHGRHLLAGHATPRVQSHRLLRGEQRRRHPGLGTRQPIVAVPRDAGVTKTVTKRGQTISPASSPSSPTTKVASSTSCRREAVHLALAGSIDDVQFQLVLSPGSRVQGTLHLFRYKKCRRRRQHPRIVHLARDNRERDGCAGRGARSPLKVTGEMPIGTKTISGCVPSRDCRPGRLCASPRSRVRDGRAARRPTAPSRASRWWSPISQERRTDQFLPWRATPVGRAGSPWGHGKAVVPPSRIRSRSSPRRGGGPHCQDRLLVDGRHRCLHAPRRRSRPGQYRQRAKISQTIAVVTGGKSAKIPDLTPFGITLGDPPSAARRTQWLMSVRDYSALATVDAYATMQALSSNVEGAES